MNFKMITREDLERMSGETTTERYRIKLINSLSGPKSAIIVGTKNREGLENGAIFSSIFHLGASPALMGLVVRPNVSPRHTLENIVEVGEFTLNHIPYDKIEKGHQTSARYPRETSEFRASGLEVEYLGDSELPFLKDSPVKWLMKFVRKIDIPENGTHILIASVEKIFIREDILREDGQLDFHFVDSAVAVGLDEYFRLGESQGFKYAKP